MSDPKQGYPREGAITRRVWDVADDVSRTTQKPATRDAVVNKCVEEGINKSTAGVQYGHWARHWGILAKATPRKVSPPRSMLDLSGAPSPHPGGWTVGPEIHAAGVAHDIEFDLANGRTPEYPVAYLNQLNQHYNANYQLETA